jgi:hypothetical protein
VLACFQHQLPQTLVPPSLNPLYLTARRENHNYSLCTRHPNNPLSLSIWTVDIPTHKHAQTHDFNLAIIDSVDPPPTLQHQAH